MKKKVTSLLLWLPPLLLMAITFYLSSRPSFSVAQRFWLNFLVFKILHTVGYFLLGLAVIRAVINTWTTWPASSQILSSFLITFAWAVSDEIHQSFVATRSGTIRDILIDTGGFLLALWLWRLLPKAPRKLKRWAKKLRFF